MDHDERIARLEEDVRDVCALNRELIDSIEQLLESYRGMRDTVTTRRVEVVNDAGDPIIVLQGGPGRQPGILINTAEGAPLVMVGATDEGGSVCVHDPTGRPLAFIEIRDGRGRFSASDGGDRLVSFGY